MSLNLTTAAFASNEWGGERGEEDTQTRPSLLCLCQRHSENATDSCLTGSLPDLGCWKLPNPNQNQTVAFLFMGLTGEFTRLYAICLHLHELDMQLIISFVLIVLWKDIHIL